jgi:hypothetical protein
MPDSDFRRLAGLIPKHNGLNETVNTRRLDELAEAIRSTVFHMLDAEQDISGDVAGKVAHAAEQAARQVMKREL